MPIKNKKTAIRKIRIKSKFADAVKRLKRMSQSRQKSSILRASDEFIRDMCSFIQQLKHRPDLVKSSHRKTLKRHRKKLRKLIHAKTPILEKRVMLTQRGGFFPFLIPIIVASITGAASIGAAATSAAIIKG